MRKVDKMDGRKIVVYVCQKGENALANLKGDGLLLKGCGYGDPGRSGMKEAFGDIGDEFFYRLGDEMPYRFAYYSLDSEPSAGLERLLEQGCRSVVVDFGIGTEIARSEWVARLSKVDGVIVVNSDDRN